MDSSNTDVAIGDYVVFRRDLSDAAIETSLADMNIAAHWRHGWQTWGALRVCGKTPKCLQVQTPTGSWYVHKHVFIPVGTDATLLVTEED